MEITKQSEVYNITDTTVDGWNITGSASKEISGSLNINIYANGTDGEIGNYSYNTYPGSDKVNISHSVNDINKDSFLSYMKTAIETVLTKLNA